MAGAVGALSHATIREAIDRDLPALQRLIERAYRGAEVRQGWSHEADLLGGPRSDADQLVESLADPARRIVVAAQDGAIVGCVEITNRGDGLGYLGLLSVDPSLQAAGLGRRLLAAAEAAARDGSPPIGSR